MVFDDPSVNLPPGMTPEMVVQAFEAAWNAGDIDRILQFFNDTAVVRFMYPPPYPEPDTYTGKDEIRRMLEGYLSGDFHMQSSDSRFIGHQMTWQFRMASDRFRSLGVDEATGSAGAVLDGGKISHFTVSFSEDTTAALEAGLRRAGYGGPISEGLAGEAAEAAGNAGSEDTGGARPNRGPTWEPVGNEEDQPPGA